MAGNEFSATGFANQIHFMKQSSGYTSELWKYVRKRQEEEKAGGRKIDYDTQIDLSGRPKFEYKEFPFKLRLIAAGIPVIFLIIFNILFFVLAVKAFLRYDVR